MQVTDRYVSHDKVLAAFLGFMVITSFAPSAVQVAKETAADAGFYQAQSSDTDFDRALAFSLKWEGGYSNHPNDTGGRTNKGITQATLNSVMPGKDVSSLTDADVRKIYRDKYWKKFNCDRYQAPLSTVCLDTFINFAPGTAKSFFKGIDTSSPKAAAIAVVEKRKEFRRDRVSREPSQSVFLKGWLRRDEDLASEVNKS